MAGNPYNEVCATLGTSELTLEYQIVV